MCFFIITSNRILGSDKDVIIKSYTPPLQILDIKK